MGAGGSKDKAGSKLQGAALEKGTGKKAGQAPTSLDAIAAKTARVSPEPTATGKTARVSPEPTATGVPAGTSGTAESNEAVPSTARRKSQDLLAVGLRRRMHKLMKLPSNFESLTLGCIDASDSDNRRIFFEIYKIYRLLHRSDLKVSAKKVVRHF